MKKMRPLLFSVMVGVFAIAFAAGPSYSSTSRPQGPTVGVRHVALVMMDEPNTCDKLHPKCPKLWTAAKAAKTMGVWKGNKANGGSVADWFSKASGGQLHVQSKVFGPWNSPGVVAYTDPITARGNPHACNFKYWWKAVHDVAGAKHKKDHFRPANFDSIIIWAPTVHDQIGHKFCGYDGVGTVAGVQAPKGTKNVIFLNGVHDVRTIVHELGHNMGLGHSGIFTCGQVDANCLSAYGDPTDVMGGCKKCLSYYDADHKYQLGWIKNKNVVTVKDGASNVLLVPSENPKKAPRDRSTELVMIPRDRYSYYSVEYRRPSGFDRGFSGVYIRFVAVMNGTWKGLHPGNDDTELFRKTRWNPGQTFYSAVDDVTVKVISAGAGGARLQVCKGPCQPPTVTVTNPPATDPPPTQPPATDPPSTDSPTTSPVITDPPESTDTPTSSDTQVS